MVLQAAAQSLRSPDCLRDVVTDVIACFGLRIVVSQGTETCVLLSAHGAGSGSGQD